MPKSKEKKYKNEYDRVVAEVGDMIREVINFSDERFNRLEARMGGLEARMGGLEMRMDKQKKEIIWIKDILEKHTAILTKNIGSGAHFYLQLCQTPRGRNRKNQETPPNCIIPKGALVEAPADGGD